MTSNPLTDPVAIVLLLGGAAALVGGVIYFFFGPSEAATRMNTFVGSTRKELTWQDINDQSNENLSQLRYWLNRSLAVFTSQQLQLQISSAYWSISDTEFILIRFSVTFLGLVIGWILMNNILGGIVLAILAYILPGFFLYRSIQQRQKKFQDQLLDVLILITGSVQSGYSLLQSLGVVINEMKAPASEEFERVVREIQVGLKMSEALINLMNRMESEDLELVVTAIIINSQVGGNLTLMLNSVTQTIRDRTQIMGEIQALTSYARYSSYLLSLLPLITGLLVFLVNRDYFKNVSESPIAQYVLIYAGISVVLGNLWLRRMIKIEV